MGVMLGARVTLLVVLILTAMPPSLALAQCSDFTRTLIRLWAARLCDRANLRRPAFPTADQQGLQ